MADYAVKRIDDMEAIYGGAFKRARAELGVESFGLQVLDFPPNADSYPEHDHSEDGQEEVYVVLAGSAEFAVAGERVEAQAGSMIRVGPRSRRTLVPGPDGVQILAIGCAPGGYERPTPFRLAARA